MGRNEKMQDGDSYLRPKNPLPSCILPTSSLFLGGRIRLRFGLFQLRTAGFSILGTLTIYWFVGEFRCTYVKLIKLNLKSAPVENSPALLEPPQENYTHFNFFSKAASSHRPHRCCYVLSMFVLST